MLKQLTLKNFVLVDTLEIDFEAGLTTITGESGAGKSILLNALALVLGERANTDTIRPGADSATVAAEFDLARIPTLSAQLETDDLTGDSPEQLLIRRTISRQGRSKAYVNNVPVTSQYLKGLAADLVDIHGQNEHMRLASRSTQLSLLDDYAGQTSQAQKVRGNYQVW